MNQTIDWWRNLGLKSKLYSLLLLNLFVVLLFSKNNAYTYSFAAICFGFIFGSLILFDTLKYAISTQPKNKKLHLVKRLFGAAVVTAIGTWSFFLFIEFSMDKFNYKNKAIEAIFKSHHQTNLRSGAAKICTWYGIAVDELNEPHRFCVEHMPHHSQLKSLENKKVLLIGRESWAGFVIDNIRENNSDAKTNTGKL